MKPRITRWCARWPATRTKLDGYTRPRLNLFDHPIRDTRDVMVYTGDAKYADIKMMNEATRPMMVLPLFTTKAQCQRYIKERFGYIAKRPDLRREPHNRRMPKPVRVTVAVTEQRNG